MLIKALCDYYDILADAGKVLPGGYSKVKIHYCVSLTEEGKIDDIIEYQKIEEVSDSKGKVRVHKYPKDVVMPERTEITGIDANIMEHRPLYLFGLNLDKDFLSETDRTNKAQKSHADFVKKTTDFLEGLDSPLINAYRKFVLNWTPGEEKENQYLLGLGKAYDKSGYIFCLSGYPDKLLHEEMQIKQKWDNDYLLPTDTDVKAVISQCSVTGETERIARVHSKIKGIPGGLATGMVLVGFNNASENSYGNEQSYNSNISQTAMKKYTEALNYLLSSSLHKTVMDDVTIVYWAMNAKENSEALIYEMLWGQNSGKNAEQTDQMLSTVMQAAETGALSEISLKDFGQIDPDVDFYMVGLKPNSSRLSVKFIYRKRYADILRHIIEFQKDMQVTDEVHTIKIQRIGKELLSPKSKNEKLNPAIMAKLFESMIYGTKYPVSLMQTMVRRVRTDTDISFNRVRAGVMKACINRNYQKEEIQVGLDKENRNQAYLCGRLFAVLEKLQQEAAKNSLNRTIKDAFFSSASYNPDSVFPKLLRLSQNHLKKTKNEGYFNKIIGEIMVEFDGGFPKILSLEDQGKFMIGYYQQYQSIKIYSGKTTEKVNENEEGEV